MSFATRLKRKEKQIFFRGGETEMSTDAIGRKEKKNPPVFICSAGCQLSAADIISLGSAFMRKHQLDGNAVVRVCLKLEVLMSDC